MPNFYKDNKDILFLLDNIDISKIILLREKDFTEKDIYEYAPSNVEDAMENYKIALDILGDICGNVVAPMAKDVDIEGARFENGEVHYANGTKEALQRLTQADFMGFTIPRKYGGLNFPKTIYSLAIEMVSRADASLMNLFGLQEISETIYRFGTEGQRKKYLPKFCSGEYTGAMALTEPDAGSDLQAVSLKATLGNDGRWYLDGVKRFITNGCADIILVLARSEPNIKGARGLSLFIYKRDEHIKIRRIEEKLGIHGSPTCEIMFTHAPAELLGERKLGLVKYTFSLMNGARLAVATQGVGIAEAAYRMAYDYASSRKQFGSSIIEFPQVYEMLINMKVDIEAARRLVYFTSNIVDLKESFEERLANSGDKTLKKEFKQYSRYASFLTPMSKIFATEMANRVAYDALQIHGGVGYTRDFEVERLYRDARITNIYEGTTQLQVHAAIGGVITGGVMNLTDELIPKI
ncbi:acyl-CoA dehydrogenase family protein, partial [Desulfothermus sp.]